VRGFGAVVSTFALIGTPASPPPVFASPIPLVAVDQAGIVVLTDEAQQ
jgi:hypothetical protein